MPEDSSSGEAVAVSPKSYGVAVTLSMIFGIVGIHHFYLGNWLHGLIDFGLFIAGFGVMTTTEDPALFFMGLGLFLIDVLHTIIVTYRLFIGKVRDGDGLLVVYPGQFGPA